MFEIQKYFRHRPILLFLAMSENNGLTNYYNRVNIDINK